MAAQKRGFYEFDAKLRATGEYFKRFTSMSELPFAWENIKSSVTDEMVKEYKDKLERELKSKFAVPKTVNSDYGMIINLDAAMEGIPECYRVQQKSKGILKLGLNVSGDWTSTEETFAVRSAAILAVFELAKTRGQQIQIDVCYGSFFEHWPISDLSHFRVSIPYPTPQIIKSVMTEEFRNLMIRHVISPAGFCAGYRLWALEKRHPELKGEFDFVLDRLETGDPEVEYKRVMEQIKKIA